MDFMELLLNRRSVREYTGEAVPKEKIEKILEDHKEEIQSEVLALRIQTGETTGYVKDWNINGEEVTLGVERA